MSRILYHDKSNWKLYSFHVKDRFREDLDVIPATDIYKVHGRYFLLFRENRLITIPMHRIRKIYKGKTLIFER